MRRECTKHFLKMDRACLRWSGDQSRSARRPRATHNDGLRQGRCMLKRIAWLILLAALASSHGALAADRTKLPGFQSYTFGMSEAELRERVQLRREAADEEGWLMAHDRVTVNGDDYDLS